MLPEVLKKLRNEKQISQATLANILGMSQQAIAKWETGNAEPDSDMLLKLASFFDVSTDYLLGRTDERNPAGTSNDDWPSEAKVLFRDVKKLKPEQYELVKNLVKQFINED